MIEEPITKFYVFQSKDTRQVVVAVPINDIIFRCQSTNNEITSILKIAQYLFTNSGFGWYGTVNLSESHTAAHLGPLVAIYTIQSHPECFL